MYKKKINKRARAKVRIKSKEEQKPLQEDLNITKFHGTGIHVNYYNAVIDKVGIIIIPVTQGINVDEASDIRFKKLLQLAFPDKIVCGMRYGDDASKPDTIEPNVFCGLYGYAIVPKEFYETRVESAEDNMLFLENEEYIYDSSIERMELRLRGEINR